MAPLRRRELGSHYATCASCRQPAVLSMFEIRAVRRGWALLDRGFDPQPYRAATCSGCRMTYPVRRNDRTPGRAARRDSDRGAVPAGGGRDWDYAGQRA